MKKVLSAIVMALSAVCLYAQTDIPAITMYYPGENPESPMELKPTMKAYTYFAAGSQVVYNKARIVQDGNVIGTCTYKGSAAGVKTTTMNPADEANAAMAEIQPGQFTLEMYEISYIVDGQEKLYSDAENPFASVTYFRGAANGKILDVAGIVNNTVKSYYSPEGEEGLVVYSFSKPVAPTSISAYFEYGGNNTYITTSLPWNLSDDGLTLSVDMRGKVYSSSVLAPGVTFKDDNGNPTDPPTTIALIITGLNCTDGTKIQTESVSPDGKTHLTLEGKVHQVYTYLDLTFPTPVLTKVEFYASSDNKTCYHNINENTNMFDLTVENLGYIETADVCFSVGLTKAVVAYNNVVRDDNKLTAAIPAEILTIGSGNLVISLENVVYNENDGAEHYIKPLSLVGSAKDVATVAQLRELAAGTPVLFNAEDGLKVTLSNDFGYTFAEDATGGISIVTEDYAKVFDEGTLIKGRIVGTWLGYDTFMIDIAKSNYDKSIVDVSTGAMINSLDELPLYEHCLVTIVASADIAIENTGDYIIIGGTIPVVTDFVEGFEMTEEINNITGVYYTDPNVPQSYILIRSFHDLNKNISTGIENVTGDAAADSIYDLRGIKVSGKPTKGGIYIIGGKKVVM